MMLDRPAGELYYEVQGEGEEVIIYLNGFASGISNWYPVIKGLKGRYRNVLYDYIGTGESRNGEEYEFCFDSYCADLGALIGQIGADRVHLVGYSMGGWIAQEFTVHHPGKVSSLVLINSSPRIFARQHWIISHLIEVLKFAEISVFSKLMFISYYPPSILKSMMPILNESRT
ncbi:MAG: alpha/beta hydrolase [Pseudomonadota bacterium]